MDHPDVVAAAIADDLGGAPPERFAAGAWSTTYAVEFDGEPVVLRVGRHGEDFAKDAIIGSVVTDLPVPAVDRRGERDAWAYAVSTRAPGTPMDDLDAAGFEAVLPALFRSHGPDGPARHRRQWVWTVESVESRRPFVLGRSRAGHRRDFATKARMA